MNLKVRPHQNIKLEWLFLALCGGGDGDGGNATYHYYHLSRYIAIIQAACRYNDCLYQWSLIMAESAFLFTLNLISVLHMVTRLSSGKRQPISSLLLILLSSMYSGPVDKQLDKEPESVSSQ